MNLYNIQILNLYETLNDFPKQITEPLPICLGYKILTNSKILQPYYDSIQKMRNDIVLKYALKNDDGTYKVPQDKIESANSELQQLLSITTEVSGLQNIELSSFGDISLPLQILENLMPIIINAGE